MKVEYDGTKFVGWQYQKNGISIQEKIEKALKKTIKLKIRINGAGRTDKGVHAHGQFANFKSIKKIVSKNRFLDSINFFLRKNLISIIDIKKKNIKFHARHSAKERVYEYIIVNRQGSLAIDKNKAWHVKKKLDLKLLKKGAKIFEGTHNFSTYRSSSCSAKSPVKKIKSISIRKSKDIIYVKFCSQSFLQNQVRSMVGCLEYLAKKKWSLKKFKETFKSKNRSSCAPPAPACGLYLQNVKY